MFRNEKRKQYCVYISMTETHFLICLQFTYSWLLGHTHTHNQSICLSRSRSPHTQTRTSKYTRATRMYAHTLKLNHLPLSVSDPTPMSSHKPPLSLVFTLARSASRGVDVSLMELHTLYVYQEGTPSWRHAQGSWALSNRKNGQWRKMCAFFSKTFAFIDVWLLCHCAI